MNHGAIMSNQPLNASLPGDPFYPPGVTGRDIDAHGGGDGASQYCRRCEEFMWPEDESEDMEGHCKACVQEIWDEEDAGENNYNES